MKTPESEIDPFIEALRGDLPSSEDEARVRARLLAAGVLLTSVASTSSVAAGSLGPAATLPANLAPAGLAKVGLLSKVLALPLAGKIGVATTLAVAVAATGVPLVAELRDPAPRAAQVSETPAPRRGSKAAEATGREVSPRMALPAELPPTRVEPSLVSPSPRTRAAGASSIQATPKRGAPLTEPSARPRNEAASAHVLPRASEGSIDRPEPASTLREETRLIEQAIVALNGGDRAAAGRWLAEHGRRFPGGLLTHERERALEQFRRANPMSGVPAE